MLDKWRQNRADAKERKAARDRAKASALADSRARKAAADAAEASDRAARQRLDALNYWQSRLDAMQQRIGMAESWTGGEPGDAAGFLLKKGEVPYLVISGCLLIEPRRAPGHFEGGHQGASFRVAKGVTYRVGGSRGTYVPGPESPTPIDQGDALISNKRVVFRGAKQTREWLFDKLLGYDHDERDGWTALQVSNRQKTSGVLYGTEMSNEVQFRLALALAEHSGTRDSLVAGLRQQEQQILASKPPS